MKKRIFALAFSLVLLLFCTVPAFADTPDPLENGEGVSDSDGFALDTAGDIVCAMPAPLLVDEASLLSTDEAKEISDALHAAQENMQFTTVIVTVTDLDGKTPTEFADDFYDENGYGVGDKHDGVLLLVHMTENRGWYISTTGYGITAFTDAGIEYAGEQIKPYLSDGDYAEAFRKFILLSENYVTEARNGTPYDTENLPRAPFSFIWLPLSLLAGFLIALIVVGSMKAKLKTVQRKSAADDYVRKDSLVVTQSRDLFLYRTVNRIAKPKETESSDGGSSTHTSSSGTTHGGGGGSF